MYIQITEYPGIFSSGFQTAFLKWMELHIDWFKTLDATAHTEEETD